MNSNGSLDTSFGTGGEAVASLGQMNSRITGLALQQDGKFVVVGSSVNSNIPDLAVGRFNANGSLDSTFATGGVLTVDLDIVPYHEATLNAVAIAADGKIVAAGSSNADVDPTNLSHFAMIRVNPSGSLDSGFGNGGVVITATSAGGDSANAVTLQSDGKIVLGGSALARYLPAEPQITSFTASPDPLTAGTAVTLTASVQDLNPTSTIAQVSFYVDSNNDGILDSGDSLLTGNLVHNGSTWTLTLDTTGWASGSYTLFVQATDSYGVLSDPQTLSLNVT